MKGLTATTATTTTTTTATTTNNTTTTTTYASYSSSTTTTTTTAVTTTTTTTTATTSPTTTTITHRWMRRAAQLAEWHSLSRNRLVPTRPGLWGVGHIACALLSSAIHVHTSSTVYFCRLYMSNVLIKELVWELFIKYVISRQSKQNVSNRSEMAFCYFLKNFCLSLRIISELKH